jgi:hypothetical protein
MHGLVKITLQTIIQVGVEMGKKRQELKVLDDKVPEYSNRMANLYRCVTQCVTDYDKDYISYETAWFYLARLNNSGVIKIDPDEVLSENSWNTEDDYSENYSPSWC